MIFMYLATGMFAGIASGMLGVGGGIIVVPVLAALFLHNDVIPSALHMHMAIGTSLAIMIVTLASSVHAHNKRRAIHWPMVKMIFPGLLIGILLGTVSIRFIASEYLKWIFAVFLVFVGVQLLWPKNNRSVMSPSKNIVKKGLFVGSVLIGIFSSLLGVGGGMLWVPFFLYSQLNMHEAVGTAVACGMVGAFVATATFTIAGAFSDVSIPMSTSYIYWPAFAGVATMSVLFAPVGAAIAYRLSNLWLKRAFAIVLLLVAFQMMFFTH